jgi:hypothetical protein
MVQPSCYLEREFMWGRGGCPGVLRGLALGGV